MTTLAPSTAPSPVSAASSATTRLNKFQLDALREYEYATQTRRRIRKQLGISKREIAVLLAALNVERSTPKCTGVPDDPQLGD